MSHPSAEYLHQQLAPLVGATIERVGVREDGDGAWPVLYVNIPGLVSADRDDHLFDLEISRDEEGNGPGFIFGLPIEGVSS